MKIILSAKRRHYMAIVSVFLVVAALIAGMVGCSCGGLVEYDLTIASTAGGSVTTPGEGTFTYDEGTVVNLTAEAEEGYLFVNWTGDVSTIADVNTATTTITMNGHYFITANFAQGQLIRNWYDLDAIRDNLGGSYLLMNDLDSTTAGYTELASPTANEGQGWQPIGSLLADPIWVHIVSPVDPFTGSLDGQGYEIRGLFVSRPDEDGVGLFGCVGGGGVVENLGMMNVAVAGRSYVGGLVGENAGTVSNSYSTGNVTGERYVGGLVGGSLGGTVSNSYSSGGVTGGSFLGGLVGANLGIVNNSYSTGSVTGDDNVGGLVGGSWSTVSNSYSTGSVTGTGWVGGLVGVNLGTVSNSYSTGSVTGYTERVGGLVGWNEEEDASVSNSYSTGNVTGELGVGGLVGATSGTVSNSYSTGSVTGDDLVGGLVGENTGTVSNSYSTGSVTGDVNVGGLVGYNPGTVSDSFWDTQTSGQATSDGGTGKTTEDMKNIETFTGAAWNIIAVALGLTDPGYIWNIVDEQDYPFLSWQS